MIIIYKHNGILTSSSLETYLDLKQSGQDVKILGRGYYVSKEDIKGMVEGKHSLYTKALGIKPAAFYINLSLAQLNRISPIFKYQKYENK